MRKFEVIEKEGVTGLTIGSYSYPPGSKFDSRQWPYGEAALESALQDGRIKDITKSGKDEKKKEKLQEKYQELANQLADLQVGKDDKKIAKIEAEMADLELKIQEITDDSK